MTAYLASADDTLAHALADYFRVNGFGDDGGYQAAWVDFKVGPIPMPFPNTASRKRAVRFHDLHHALTGYATDLRGELEISAWEIGSGCADHVAAWYLNLSATATGVILAPRRTWRAFLRGRRCRNLYRARYDDALLGRRVADVRRELGLLDDAPAPARAQDAAWFAVATLAGGIIAVLFTALLIPTAIVANLAALFARR